jgi:hypothetical protein
MQLLVFLEQRLASTNPHVGKFHRHFAKDIDLLGKHVINSRKRKRG